MADSETTKPHAQSNTMTNIAQAIYDLRFRYRLRNKLKAVFPIVDAVTSPATALGALYLKGIRRIGLSELPVNRRVFQRIGVYPVRAHYYEPYVVPSALRYPLSESRHLPGVNINIQEQLEFLQRLQGQAELARIPIDQGSPTEFGFSNGTFSFADAAALYCILRTVKPKRFFEVGAGNSTLIASKALAANMIECGGAGIKHKCIEPFEMPWLENLPIEVIRKPVEALDPAFFDELGADDVLFIDSSHMVRPQGDVLFLYQAVLPRLRSGVLIHVHDIFTPRDYPRHWVIDRGLMWNEQYLLEAFLAFNDKFRVFCALNLLYRDHFDALASALPILKAYPQHEPMSFWLKRQ